MYDYKIVEQVSRKKKSMSGILRKVMILFAVIFVIMGIAISQSFMLAGFLLAALYFVFDIFSQKDYEYTLENDQLSIDVIYGKKYRKTAHLLELKDLEVVAPHWHESVAKYKKNGGTEQLKKFDYTAHPLAKQLSPVSMHDYVPFHSGSQFCKTESKAKSVESEGEPNTPVKLARRKALYSSATPPREF